MTNFKNSLSVYSEIEVFILIAFAVNTLVKFWNIAPAEDASLTISIGLSTLTPVQGTDCWHLIMEADKGLYTAKHNGRNLVGIE
ncbi:diguanylate cyclase [Pseudomonas sp. PA-1-2A]|nr:diguanylate cyclase [Pseudomonas sp. PA-1-8C]MCF5789391.1 diguanylate cyclase [Pseudomonas sp. PA-1-6G]MCF5794707.1 diguanylate cyclase [Pseudomonas sp. PA-1-6B]MCF5800271.1 diguanylate cyclase [Pseudomonas sp. PA-1-5A]MCF5816266.1 diguanylate cyclase [Pseudomonas sp. PA-1-2A]MCF5836692.1 diguanylate cyclase [Pseudomonas sp. PA-1-6A]MCF8968539.1 diguanylate cyclase [Pseudomonas carnis]